ncbi:MAG TPA: trypsin-like peptidase domain-containing protein [Propionibacterium sp.]|nr:trypsin-like peptidase domain-containing protein [Propionibacterium sp.]
MRLTRPVIAAVIGIFVVAIALGVGAAFLIRERQSANGRPTPTPPPPATSTPGTTDPVPPDQLEPPELPADGPYAEIARVAASGTHRIVATTCTGTGVGTAFQFGTEGRLVTSARAVSGARSIAVLSGDRVVPATVAKIDAVSGVALLKPEAPLAGHTFELGTRLLAVNDEVALLGWTTESQHPARGRLRVAVGKITEAGLTVESPDGRHPEVRRMAGEFDPGLAGSPVVGEDGRLLGVVLQNAAGQTEVQVAGLDTVADPLLGPTGLPSAMEPCVAAAGPQIVTTVGGQAPDGARTTLAQWFGALNAGDWDRAHGVLSDDLQAEWPVEKLVTDHQGAYLFAVTAGPPDGADITVSWVQLRPEGDQRCQRMAATMTVEGDRIRSYVQQEPAACS